MGAEVEKMGRVAFPLGHPVYKAAWDTLIEAGINPGQWVYLGSESVHFVGPAWRHSFKNHRTKTVIYFCTDKEEGL